MTKTLASEISGNETKMDEKINELEKNINITLENIKAVSYTHLTLPTILRV